MTWDELKKAVSWQFELEHRPMDKPVGQQSAHEPVTVEDIQMAKTIVQTMRAWGKGKPTPIKRWGLARVYMALMGVSKPIRGMYVYLVQHKKLWKIL